MHICVCEYMDRRARGGTFFVKAYSPPQRVAKTYAPLTRGDSIRPLTRGESIRPQREVKAQPPLNRNVILTPHSLAFYQARHPAPLTHPSNAALSRRKPPPLVFYQSHRPINSIPSLFFIKSYHAAT